MSHFRQRLAPLLLGMAAAAGMPPAAAAQQIITFDAPANGLAAVQAQYGLTTSGGVLDAQVIDGQLLLFGAGGVNGNAVFAAAPGDLRFEFDAAINDTPGNVNVGFTTGNQVFYIHPGYWDDYFVPGLALRGHLGFTPDWTQPTHFSVDISASGLVNVVIQNNHRAFLTSFTDPAYVAGVSQPGLTMGSVRGYWAVYDNLVITTVPEPGAAWLWALGLTGLLACRPGSRRPGSARMAAIPERPSPPCLKALSRLPQPSP
ncbi:MAG: hypothetical protein CFE45_09555 [Burkholderiales bacterium PBB5]|nr:MAG: hypothetical protein CFE45_09555 [Burkholderiales bacterium PBB5]